MKRIKIVSGGHGNATSLLDADTGRPLKLPIAAIGIQIEGGKPATVLLQVAVASIQIESEATYVLTDPRTDKPRPLKRIEFDDGYVIDFTTVPPES